MDLENLKVYIQQATGHKNVNSLDNYIDIAKSELTSMDKVVDNLLEVRDIGSIEKEKHDFKISSIIFFIYQNID